MSGPDHGEVSGSDDELDPDEPRTPLWLPLLGLCLFVAAVVYALTGQKPAPAEEPAPSASASQAAPAAAPAPVER
jgi:hypothetical protein